jgi:hypothetical protein
MQLCPAQRLGTNMDVKGKDDTGPHQAPVKSQCQGTQQLIIPLPSGHRRGPNRDRHIPKFTQNFQPRPPSDTS